MAPIPCSIDATAFLFRVLPLPLHLDFSLQDLLPPLVADDSPRRLAGDSVSAGVPVEAPLDAVRHPTAHAARPMWTHSDRAPSAAKRAAQSRPPASAPTPQSAASITLLTGRPSYLVPPPSPAERKLADRAP